MRRRDGITCQSYRNRLFKLLFQKFSQGSKEEWEDRDRHRPVIDALVEEILNDSEAILSQK